jgi:hypothetical protein
MFPTIYFPLISLLASTSPPKGLWEMLREGYISSSVYHISRIVECSEHEIHTASGLQLRADLQTTLGLQADAEESYRQSLRLYRTGSRDLHVASLRNTGWQAFFRGRFATAMACFERLTEEHGIEQPRRMEGMFGILCVLSQLGSLQAAAEVL